METNTSHPRTRQKLPWPTQHDLAALAVCAAVALPGVIDPDAAPYQAQAGRPEIEIGAMPRLTGATAVVYSNPRPPVRDYLNRTPFRLPVPTRGVSYGAS